MVSGVRRRALVDLGAIVANARSGGADLGSSTADLRADAYGHGLLAVAGALRAAGVRRFAISPNQSALLGDPVFRGVDVFGTHNPTPTLGLELFGLGDSPALRTTLRLRGEIIAIKNVPAGQGVSYGYTYRTTAPTRLALVGLGFADGIPRIASNRAPIRIGELLGRVSGRIAMDQLVVDIGETEAAVGDDAVLFGDPELGEPSIDEWAGLTGIPAEALLAGLGQRIQRAYRTEDKA